MCVLTRAPSHIMHDRHSVHTACTVVAACCVVAVVQANTEPASTRQNRLLECTVTCWDSQLEAHEPISAQMVCVRLRLQDRYEVLTKQFANAGIRGLTDIITPANKDLSRWVLLEQGAEPLSWTQR